MRVACHFAIPKPPRPELDAAVQDAMRILERVAGEINYLYPGRKARRMIPRFACGLHQLAYLRALEQRVDVHHVFANGLYPYPILRFFSKPVVYTSVIQVSHVPLFARFFLRPVNAFTVCSVSDRERLSEGGLPARVITPAIETERFTREPLAEEEPFVVLSGSAPWNVAQFRSKGVDALLAAARELPWLRLIFLWRGKLYEEMQARIGRLHLEDRVEVIPQRVDVNAMLAKVHAAVVLAEKAELVKAFPHSLLEALAAGRPVLISRCLAMADFIEAKGCGLSIRELETAQVIAAIVSLRDGYRQFAHAAQALDVTPFSAETMVEAYLTLYREVLAGGNQRT